MEVDGIKDNNYYDPITNSAATTTSEP